MSRGKIDRSSKFLLIGVNIEDPRNVLNNNASYTLLLRSHNYLRTGISSSGLKSVLSLLCLTNETNLFRCI